LSFTHLLSIIIISHQLHSAHKKLSSKPHFTTAKTIQ
jgi:hypothetical protein